MTRVAVENIALLDPIAPKTYSVAVITNFEHATPDVRRIACQESLNISSVDWLAAVKAEMDTDRRCSSQIPRLTFLARRCFRSNRAPSAMVILESITGARHSI